MQNDLVLKMASGRNRRQGDCRYQLKGITRRKRALFYFTFLNSGSMIMMKGKAAFYSGTWENPANGIL